MILWGLAVVSCNESYTLEWTPSTISIRSSLQVPSDMPKGRSEYC